MENPLIKGDAVSALGENAKCNNCGKYIKTGDNVIQIFAGPVEPCYKNGEDEDEDNDFQELCVNGDKGTYRLFHSDCFDGQIFN